MAIYTRKPDGGFLDERGNNVDRIYKFSGNDEDQVKGQIQFTEDAELLGTEDAKDEIINEDGSSGQETAIGLLKDKNFDPRKFMNEFSDNADRALNGLLAMQTNNAPLKKGGPTVSYLCDVLIIAMRSLFDTNENTLMDVITGAISSAPENKSYRIYSKDIGPYLKYKDKNYLNKVLNGAAETLKTKNALPVDVTLPNGKRKEFTFPWYTGLLYTPTSEISDEDESAYIDMVPSPLFKALVISSTVTHGAHYSISISTQFVGYTRTLFYYLESRKNYREYPGATPGVFKMTMEELRYLLKCPDKYRTSEITRILKAAKEKFDETDDIDFTMEYEPTRRGHSITGYKFTIKSIASVIAENNKGLIEENEIDEEGRAVKQMLAGLGLSDKEQDDVLKKYKANNRDLAYLSQCFAKLFSQTTEIKSKCAYLCWLMDGKEAEAMQKDDNNISGTKESGKNPSKFNNFNQREYNMDELQKTLLNTRPE